LVAKKEKEIRLGTLKKIKVDNWRKKFSAEWKLNKWWYEPQEWKKDINWNEINMNEIRLKMIMKSEKNHEKYRKSKANKGNKWNQEKLKTKLWTSWGQMKDQ